MRLMVLLFLALGATAPSMAQSPPPDDRNDVARASQLRQLSASIQDWIEARQSFAYHEILTSTDPVWTELLANPDVRLMYIDDHGYPVVYTTFNLNAARTIRTDDVWPGGVSGYNLTGAGTAGNQFGIWDGGSVRATHQELTGRVTQIDAPPALSGHSTHVAGTMIATGINANAQGMSFQANLNAWDFGNDSAEMAAAAANGMLVSNHSYGRFAGWDTSTATPRWWGDVNISNAEDFKFGQYDTGAQLWDQIAVNAPNYLIVKAAGNDRIDFAPPAGTAHNHLQGGAFVAATDNHPSDGGATGFDTIPTSGCAKNILTVGAINDIPAGYAVPGDVVQSAFSGWGPTDDGRIKPDLVANGVALFSLNSGTDTDYTTMSGTSMSAPNASGSINLLRGQFFAINGVQPRSATLKALVIHTADEAGADAGPDYANGWGLMNTRSAGDVIAATPLVDPRGIIEDALNNAGTDTHTLFANSAGDVRVTIAWTDPAGTPPAVAVDAPNLMLVNDLDLRVTHVPSATTSMPWVLNPANPAIAATTSDNTRDNVEQVLVAGAPTGMYQVTVSHKSTLSGSPQQYSLIFSGLSPNAAPTAVCRNVTKAADASCLATVLATEVDGGSSDREGDPITLSLSPLGPYGLGSNVVTLTVTDDKGASSTCQATVTVVDISPPVFTSVPAPIASEQSSRDGTSVAVPLATATDNCDAQPVVTSDAPVVFPLGTTTVTFTATDASGNAASATTTVTVVDTTPPDIRSLTADPGLLWPPNHRMVRVSVAVSVSDVCDAAPSCRIVAVTTNDTSPRGGSGNTSPDWETTGDLTVSLRAERSGNLGDRVYSLAIRCTDDSGNSSTGTVGVRVPHDRGSGEGNRRTE